eukprot:g330.t1
MLTSARVLRQGAAAAPAKRMVCKFGGTSMATADSLAHVHQILEEKGRVGVVVSAPGKRFKGDTKTTDLLIQLHKLFISAGDGGEQAVSGGNAGSFISSASKEEQVRLQEELALQIEERFSFVRKSSASIAEQLLKASDRREYDFMVSRGEFYCGRAMADALGYDFLDPAEVVFLRPEDGGVDYPYTMDAIRANLSSVENNNKGVVLPGFFGTDRGTKKVRALPRGGSDITGALLADAMAADEYENWTDVDGVFTADPNLIPSALKIDQLSHSELFTLGKNGAQVLHPGTVKAMTGPAAFKLIEIHLPGDILIHCLGLGPIAEARTSCTKQSPSIRINDKVGNYQEPKDYTFPRWGNTHPTKLMAKEKGGVIFGLLVLFMAVCFLASVDVDRAQAGGRLSSVCFGVAFYFYSTVALFTVLGLFVSAIWGHGALRNDFVPFYLGAVTLTFVAAYVAGICNFYTNVSSYMAQKTGRHYFAVQPTSEAAAFQDAGRLDFGPMARILDDTTVGYKIDGEIYCAAPIIDPNAGAGATLQFFAVGKNCCEHEGRFNCVSYGTMTAGLLSDLAEDTTLGGYVVGPLVSVDEGGFWEKLVRDMHAFLMHGTKLKTDHDVYRSQAEAIGATLARSVSKDAVFVELGDPGTTYVDSLVSINSEVTGNSLQSDLTLNSTEASIWYYSKVSCPGKSCYNILAQDPVTDTVKYLGATASGELALKAKDGGTGSDGGGASACVLQSGQYFAREEVTVAGETVIKAKLAASPPQPDPNFRTTPPVRTEIEHRFFFFGPFFLYGSWSGLGTWLTSGFLYLLFVIVILSALRPAGVAVAGGEGGGGVGVGVGGSLRDVDMGGGNAAAVSRTSAAPM